MPTPQRLDAVFFRSLPKGERKAIGEDIAYVQRFKEWQRGET